MTTDTDRALLEAAARAAGIPIYEWRYDERTDAWMGARSDSEEETVYWNPLQDDGDALRLAVKLGFLVETGRCWVSTYGPMYGEDVLPCPYAATRRAIVRAAAAMAEQEKTR